MDYLKAPADHKQIITHTFINGWMDGQIPNDTTNTKSILFLAVVKQKKKAG